MSAKTTVMIGHAAQRPDGLRAIAEGIAHPNSTFTIASVQECLRVAADRIEALEQSLLNVGRGKEGGK